MNIHQKSKDLYLIDLDQELTGFRQFISCWVYQKINKTILIDPGPASTIPVLQKALNTLQIKKIDYILLTHIHIDHAGGTGLLLSKFPTTKVICHPKGIPHMINPEKLWQGSLKVLGEIARVYKPIVPLPANSISYLNKIDKGLTIEIIETPGHAMHHLTFLIDGYLFAGEAAGVNYPLLNDFYLRIATPPRFIFETYKNSLYKASELECDKICFGHYGMRNDVKKVFNQAKEQLELWFDTTQTFYEKNTSVETEEIFRALLSTDPSIKSFSNLDEDIQKREKYFALNSIKGMLEYLKKTKSTNHSQ